MQKDIVTDDWCKSIGLLKSNNGWRIGVVDVSPAYESHVTRVFVHGAPIPNKSIWTRKTVLQFLECLGYTAPNDDHFEVDSAWLLSIGLKEIEDIGGAYGGESPTTRVFGFVPKMEYRHSFAISNGRTFYCGSVTRGFVRKFCELMEIPINECRTLN